MNLGNHDYMIMATEGYQSSGNSNINVGGGGSSPPPGGGNPPPPGGGGDGSCTVTVSPGDSWSDRFNVNFTVSGSSDWVVTINLGGGQTLQNRLERQHHRQQRHPHRQANGNGNNFGITLYRNGNDSMPTASCSSSGGGGNNPPPGGGNNPPPGGGGAAVSVSPAESWSDRFNVTFSVNGTSNWVVTINLSGGQTLQNSWNASITGNSGTLTARPNGNGNNFGITVYRNGNNNLPTASCQSG